MNIWCLYYSLKMVENEYDWLCLILMYCVGNFFLSILYMYVYMMWYILIFENVEGFVFWRILIDFWLGIICMI